MRDSVIIIGSGLMGSGIAACSALAGNRTVLIDLDKARALAGVQKAYDCIDELVENDLAKDAEKAKALITADNSFEKYTADASLVIEAIIENLEAKQVLFEQLDALFPLEVPLVSNTSGLRITDIAARTSHPERTATTHFWFPAHLVPLVEVVVGDHTNPEVASQVCDVLRRWGKAAVLVKKDLPGQLANRILQAVIREAINIVEIGLASPEDVDTAIKAGMGIRFPVWGALEHIEAVGLDLALNVQRTVLPEISSSQTPAACLEDMVASGNLGYKTGSGFYDWSRKDMDALVKKRNAFIISARKILEKA